MTLSEGTVMCMHSVLSLIFHFVPINRSNLNLLQRQPSQPVPESSIDDSTPLTRSFTISGDVRLRNRQEDKPVHPLTTPIQQAKPESEAAADEKKEDHPSLTSHSSETTGDDSVPHVHVQESTEEGGTGRDKMEGESGEELDRERGAEKEEGERQTAEEKRSAEMGEEGERVKVEEKESSVEGEDERVKSKLESRLSSGQLQEEEEEAGGFLGRSQSVDESVRQAPGFQFITRPDLYKFAKV